MVCDSEGGEDLTIGRMKELSGNGQSHRLSRLRHAPAAARASASRNAASVPPLGVNRILVISSGIVPIWVAGSQSTSAMKTTTSPPSRCMASRGRQQGLCSTLYALKCASVIQARRHAYGKRIIMHAWRLVGLFWVGSAGASGAAQRALEPQHCPE